MTTSNTRATRLSRRAAATLAVMMALAAPASAQDTYIGEIKAFPFNWCPRNFALAGGQLLPIASNTALFSLYGSTYGGDGISTFALPNLNGRTPIGTGRGPGLSNRPLGQQGGEARVTLTTPQMPMHVHQMLAAQSPGTQTSPAGATPATGVGPGRGAVYYGTTGTAVHMNAATLSSNGGSSAHENRPPYLVLNWCVAVEGIYPSRP
ncbi:phage tail protein [Sagittula salina]|nr:tail fiber protein [Sagittula salina]